MMGLENFQPTPFLDLLSTDLVEGLRAAGHQRTLTDGQFVHSRGDLNPALCIIENGAAQAGIYEASGLFTLTSYIGRGHTFGEFTVFTSLPRTHDISALGETTLLEIPASRFNALCDAEPRYLRAMLEATLMRSHMLLEMLHALRSLPRLPRVAKFLLILSPPSATRQILRFRQSDLAASLGLSRATLNHALSDLSDAGLIERGYGQICIPDRGALVDWLNTARS